MNDKCLLIGNIFYASNAESLAAAIRMSDKFDNNMRGVLFTRLKEKDGSPDYKGDCEINGLKFWISAWTNHTKDRRPYISLRFQPKDGTMDEISKRVINPHAAAQAEEYNDEIPF